MPFPTGWPPTPPSHVRSLRVRIAGTATASFEDNAYLFSQVVVNNAFVPLAPVVEPGSSAQVTLPPNPSTSASPSVGTPAMDVPMQWASTIVVRNLTANPLSFSFDGTNIHGVVPANGTTIMERRYEAGIALSGSGGFEVEAW